MGERVGVLTSFCLVSSPRKTSIESVFLVVICVSSPIHGRRSHRYPKTGVRPRQRMLLNDHTLIQLRNGAPSVDASKVALQMASSCGSLAALMRVLMGPRMLDRSSCKAMRVDSTLILLLLGLFDLL